MSGLEDSILVIVDCSRIDRRTIEDLFMNNREQMEDGEFLSAIESELESILKDNQALRDLRQQRRHEDVQSKLQDSKPFKEILESMIRRHPSVAQLLGSSGPLSDPFRSRKARAAQSFIGKQHPSFFRHRGKDYGEELKRTTPINMRSRISFETDVVNEYFTRGQYVGKYVLHSCDEGLLNGSIPDYNLNLQNGIATLNLSLPSDAKVGDSFRYDLVVWDETLVEPFVNRFVISVGQQQKPSGGERSRKHLFDNGDSGDEDARQGLALPTCIPVYEAEWGNHGFDRNSALKPIYYPSEDEETPGSYTYFINMDNVHLNTELKATKEDLEIVKSRWQYGMALIAMALLSDASLSQIPDGTDQAGKRDDVATPEEEVFKVTSAIAPVLLPLIEHLGDL